MNAVEQFSGVGAKLAVRVRVTREGQALAHERVLWRAIEGGGKVDSTFTTTDADGETANDWTLGVEIGQNLLLITAANAHTTVRAETEFQFASVTVGLNHACALSTSGEAYCWGDNTFGKLGLPNEGAAPRPTRVRTNLRFIQLAAGWTHTCGLAVSRVVYCWGDNTEGQLGYASAFNRVFEPAAVQSDQQFTAIAAGSLFSCGTAASGAAYCWGKGSQGQLGTGSLSSSGVPVRTASTSQFVNITAGEYHACGITAQGRAQCWGWNTSGELGANARTDSIARIPIDVIASAHFSSIAAGSRHTCALADDGNAWCWGRNGWGENGLPPFVSTPVPVAVVSSRKLTQLDAGEELTCGVDAGTANVVCIGFDGFREYGRSWSPIPSNVVVSSVSAGGTFACMAARRELLCWGGSYGATPVVLPGRVE